MHQQEFGLCRAGEAHTGSVAAEAHHKAQGKEMCGRAAEDAKQVSAGTSSESMSPYD